MTTVDNVERIKLTKFILRARNDFTFFCKEVLGYKYDKATGFKDFTQAHDELCGFLVRRTGKSKLILNPRYSFKSQICTVASSLFDMVRDPNIRILIYSDNESKAQGFLQDIKNHIEGTAPNSLFRKYFPNWETSPSDKNGRWNERQIVISKREDAYKEPNVDTGGIETSKVGMHYDKIIFDDIVSDINTTSKQQMDKVYNCYKRSLSLLKPGGDIIIVGTRWHFGDAYGRIIDNNEDANDFDLFIKNAEETEPNGKLIYEDIGLDRTFLDYQKSKQGSYTYSCLYLNNPVSDETALFKIENFRFYQYNAGFDDNLFKLCLVDPSGMGEDYTAIVIVGIDDKKNMYVLEAVNSHALCKPSNITKKVIDLSFKWGFNKLILEKNYYRGTLTEHIKEARVEHESNRMFKNFSVEPVTASSINSTVARIKALQPYHEQGRIFFPGKSFNTLQRVYADLGMQMIQFTLDGCKSPHDDLIVAFSLVNEAIIAGGKPIEKSLPPTSAVAYMEEKINTLRRANIPRRFKQNLVNPFK